jgi:anhydro-N-acetylmuramic acid kinase
MHFLPVHILGLMSGTSLDGLDLCLVKFEGKGHIEWEILKAETKAYDQVLVDRLRQAHLQSDGEIGKLNFVLGERIASDAEDFCHGLSVDVIATHGHTIKHRPDLGYTLQIGNPVPLYEKLHCPVVFDFRSQDVALGGQGAPLVPIGDKMLFSEYDFCVNIGGFANCSTEIDGRRIAGDICVANVVLNKLAESLGFSYDDRGKIARQGKVDSDLLSTLNELSFYEMPGPKSLGREWVDQEIWPLLDASELNTEDLLATFVEHSAVQIARIISHGRALFTGGGVRNDFLMERIRRHSDSEIIIPSGDLVDFKEALIFALLGLLRVRDEINVLSSVTGAKHDHCSGQILVNIPV